jgi:hypothetical protein
VEDGEKMKERKVSHLQQVGHGFAKHRQSVLPSPSLIDHLLDHIAEFLATVVSEVHQD